MKKLNEMKSQVKKQVKNFEEVIHRRHVDKLKTQEFEKIRNPSEVTFYRKRDRYR